PVLRSPARTLIFPPLPGSAATVETVSRHVAITALSWSVQPSGGGISERVSGCRLGPLDVPGPVLSAPGISGWGPACGRSVGVGVQERAATAESKSAHPTASIAAQPTATSAEEDFARLRDRAEPSRLRTGPSIRVVS